MLLRFVEMGWPHAGVLLVAPSLPNDRFNEIAVALIEYDHSHGKGMLAYQIGFLPGA